jgi:hypothetical protein
MVDVQPLVSIAFQYFPILILTYCVTLLDVTSTLIGSSLMHHVVRCFQRRFSQTDPNLGNFVSISFRVEMTIDSLLAQLPSLSTSGFTEGCNTI